MSESKALFKAFIRVVKSISERDNYFLGGFGAVEVVREPLIEAKDKSEVKKILLERYPQFFTNGKVYERETKDNAQFFYVVIYPLYEWEKKQIEEGEWVCESCGHVHENQYLSNRGLARGCLGQISYSAEVMMIFVWRIIRRNIIRSSGY